LILKIFKLGINLGLLIKNGVVIVDDSINDHMITTTNGNPKRQFIKNINGEIDVTSIFTRTKRKSDHEKVGDSSPIIYALKKKQGLKTTRESILKLRDSASEIIASIDVKPGSLLVCTPSSFNIVEIFAKRFAKQKLINYETDVFSKSTKESAISDFEKALCLINDYKSKKEIKNIVDKMASNPDPILSLKEVPPKYRQYINPVVLKKTITAKNIILVDDLVSSGTTLICAKNQIQSICPESEISGLSLISSLSK